MSQTTAHTFITAALLLVLSVILYLYGEHIIEREISAGHKGYIIMCGSYDERFDSWAKAAGWTGLVAVSVAIGGVIFWARETQPVVERPSIFRLDERAPGQMVAVAAPLPEAVIANAHIDESNLRRHQEESPSEDEYLTPLERVIRGY